MEPIFLSETISTGVFVVFPQVQRLQLALIEMQQSQLNGSFGMTR